jgi:G:T/U-mismatch repair DNA glycosylase
MPASRRRADVTRGVSCSAKRPADTAAAPSSAKKPKTAAATTTTPAQTALIQEPSLPSPAEAAKLLPSRDGKWTSPFADLGGGGRIGSFEAIIDSSVRLPHTLLVGTQPATKSLANCWYFANDTNAFWHITGHALRFRRGFHEQARPDGDVVPSIAKHLRGGELHRHEQRDTVVADYEEAVARLQGAGYALWDILSSSVRKSKKSGKQSSLDSDIRTPKPADIEGLVRDHPTIRRIVFVTGKGSADTFRKHFSEW